MKTKKIKLCEVSSTVLFIGFEGEQNYRRVEIDATEVFAEMPDAVPSMAIKPPVGDVYPKALERDGNTIVWEISASDCATVGDGAYQLTFIDGESIGKEFKGYFKVFDALVGSGEAPEPIEDFVEFANAVLAALQNMTASAETIPASEPATAEITQIGGHKNLALGIPAGEPGIDGISPTISITDIPGGHRLTVTDANGTHTFDVMDGTPGAPGQDGQDGTDGTDGVSPTVTVTDITGGHQVTITDVSGAHTFNVMDGMGDTSLIAKDYADMTFPVAAGVYCVKDNVLYKAKEAIATQEAWTAAHWLACPNVGTELSSLKSTIDAKADEPTGTKADGKIYALAEVNGEVVPVWITPVVPTVPVQDVQVGGMSIVGSGGVANIPNAGQNTLGVVKSNRLYGIDINDGNLTINRSTDDGVKEGANNTEGKNRPITPYIQHASTFYGLAKAAGADMASISSPTIGVYPEAQKSAISDMLNAPETISGTTPTITAKSGVRYICGECSTLTITAPASGCIDVTFVSGSTPTVLTVSSAKTGVTAIKWANGFDPSSLDANTTYEVNILDGEFGVVGSWT